MIFDHVGRLRVGSFENKTKRKRQVAEDVPEAIHTNQNEEPVTSLTSHRTPVPIPSTVSNRFESV